MNKTKKHGTGIEWTHIPGFKGETWNPLVGCTKVSPGCINCYAEREALRWQKAGTKKYENGFELTIFDIPKYMDIPKRWTKPRAVFVNSMSDLFHEKVTLKFIQKTFVIMNEAKQHIFLILTKRDERLFLANEFLPWKDNIWMGVSVEDQKRTSRIDFLKKTNASLKFLSCEPLLGPLELDLEGIDWVLCGGESGQNPREMKKEWALSVRDQCKEQGVPFFFKQQGGKRKCQCCWAWGCGMLDKEYYHEFPDVKIELDPKKYFNDTERAMLKKNKKDMEKYKKKIDKEIKKIGLAKYL